MQLSTHCLAAGRCLDHAGNLLILIDYISGGNSVIENAGRMGLNVPVLKMAIDVLRKKTDDTNREK